MTDYEGYGVSSRGPRRREPELACRSWRAGGRLELPQRHHRDDVDLHQHPGPGELADIQGRVRRQRRVAILLDPDPRTLLDVAHVGVIADLLHDVSHGGAVLR